MATVYFVTGGFGLIGSAIVRNLASDARNRIFVFDDPTELSWSNLPLWPNVQIVPKAAVDTEIIGLMAKFQPVAVIHMGAITDTQCQNLEALMCHNVRLTAFLASMCRAHVPPIPFIYASSAAVYGFGEFGFSEDIDPTLLQPRNAYAWSKLNSDVDILGASRSDGTQATWYGLRFFNVYGPGEYHKQKMQSFASRTLEQLHNNVENPSTLLFDWESVGYKQPIRDFVYVDDCVRVIESVIDKRPPYGIYNVGSGVGNTFEKVAELLENSLSAWGVDLRIGQMPAPEAIIPGYQFNTVADMPKLADSGCYVPDTTLKEGLRKMTEWAVLEARARWQTDLKTKKLLG